jgi:hypothetical protein
MAVATLFPAQREAEERGCAFIVGAGTPPPVRCGASRQAGSSYCPRHHALCHLPAGSAVERRKLRELEGLARAAGGRTGGHARHPPPAILRRFDRLTGIFCAHSVH